MRVIVGLGNPGTKYELTRHNAGFLILDRFAGKNNLVFHASKFDFYYSEGSLDSSDFFLVKPTTYMNLSGLAILDFMNEHPVVTEDLLVVVDDVNIPLGQVRLRQSGSDGGHNGIKSIIYHLQNDAFPRLRFGIGSDFEKGEMADYVLSKFKHDEFADVTKSIDFSVELIEKFITGGYKSMLDYFSRFSNLINKPKQDFSDSDESSKIKE